MSDDHNEMATLIAAGLAACLFAGACILIILMI
jgi:hypothetical protein